MIKLKVMEFAEEVAFQHELQQFKHCLRLASTEHSIRKHYIVYLNTKTALAISAVHYGNVPEVVLFNGPNVIFVGFDDKIVLVNGIPYEVLRVVECDAPFYTFEDISKIDCIAAVHELGIKCFSINGELKWSYDARDIITDWRIAEHMITITLMESPGFPVHVDISTGTYKLTA